LFNLKPASFGLPAQNFVTFADNYGNETKHWDGFDLTASGRIRRDLQLQGGISTGRTTIDLCDIVAKLPSVLLGSPIVTDANAGVWMPASFCHEQTPFLTVFKLLSTYTIPRVDVQVSGTFQSTPGPAVAANFVANNATVSPSLGRNLSGGASNITVNLVQPGSLYGERANQLDLRFGKIVKVGKSRSTISLDLYNITNANPVLTQNNSFATWQAPTSILPARFAKLVYQLNF
jgi:hypothetical protein